MFQFLLGVAFGAGGYWAWQSFGRDLLGMSGDQETSYGGFNSGSSTSSFGSSSSGSGSGSSTSGYGGSSPTDPSKSSTSGSS